MNGFHCYKMTIFDCRQMRLKSSISNPSWSGRKRWLKSRGCKAVGWLKKKEFEKGTRLIVAAVAQAAPHGAVVARWRCWCGWWAVANAAAQRSPLGWAMGSSQRMAAVAAVSHAKHYYNNTRPDVTQTSEATHYTVNIFFVRSVKQFLLYTNKTYLTIAH